MEILKLVVLVLLIVAMLAVVVFSLWGIYKGIRWTTTLAPEGDWHGVIAFVIVCVDILVLLPIALVVPGVIIAIITKIIEGM